MEHIFTFDEKVISVGLQADDCYDALRQMSAMLYQAGYVKESYQEAIISRERIFPTGLPTGGVGVAIPHADACHVKASMIAVGILENPVRFKNITNAEVEENVKIIFMMAMNNSERQVKLLSAFMANLQDQKLLQQLTRAADVAAVAALLKGKIKF